MVTMLLPRMTWRAVQRTESAMVNGGCVNGVLERLERNGSHRNAIKCQPCISRPWQFRLVDSTELQPAQLWAAITADWLQTT